MLGWALTFFIIAIIAALLLTGSVSTEAERRAATSSALRGGAVFVQNLLNVEPQ